LQSIAYENMKRLVWQGFQGCSSFWIPVV
jgi:hypothetical protein